MLTIVFQIRSYNENTRIRYWMTHIILRFVTRIYVLHRVFVCIVTRIFSMISLQEFRTPVGRRTKRSSRGNSRIRSPIARSFGTDCNRQIATWRHSFAKMAAILGIPEARSMGYVCFISRIQDTDEICRWFL